MGATLSDPSHLLATAWLDLVDSSSAVAPLAAAIKRYNHLQRAGIYQSWQDRGIQQFCKMDIVEVGESWTDFVWPGPTIDDENVELNVKQAALILLNATYSVTEYRELLGVKDDGDKMKEILLDHDFKVYCLFYLNFE